MQTNPNSLTNAFSDIQAASPTYNWISLKDFKHLKLFSSYIKLQLPFLVSFICYYKLKYDAYLPSWILVLEAKYQICFLCISFTCMSCLWRYRWLEENKKHTAFNPNLLVAKRILFVHLAFLGVISDKLSVTPPGSDVGQNPGMWIIIVNSHPNILSILAWLAIVNIADDKIWTFHQHVQYNLHVPWNWNYIRP